MKTIFCDKGHIVSIEERKARECPFCKSRDLRITDWIKENTVSVDPCKWEVYMVYPDKGDAFQDFLPMYDVTELFQHGCIIATCGHLVTYDESVNGNGWLIMYEGCQDEGLSCGTYCPLCLEDMKEEFTKGQLKATEMGYG